MTNAKRLKQLLLTVPMFLVGCGLGELAVVEEGFGPDTESEPTLNGEAELRATTTFDSQFEAAGAEFNVPAAILKSIAWSQTRYQMVQGEPEFQGQPMRSGLMALWGAQLTQGAAKAKVSEGEARTQSVANIRTAAAYLSILAERAQIDRNDLNGWASVLAAYSNIDEPEAQRAFAQHEVLGTLTLGVGRLSQALKSSGTFKQLDPPKEDALQLTQALAAGLDYGPAIWRPSPNFNSRAGVKPSMVIIHTCEGGYSGCWGWLRDPAANASAHYVVSTGSEVSQLVRESDRAWHVAASYNCELNSNVDCALNGSSTNNFTVGIEHAGFASQTTFPVSQLEASARLTCNITQDHRIPRDRFHVVGHGQLQPANRRDPGPNWPWTDYLRRVNAACGSTPVPAAPVVIDSNNARNNQAVGYIQVSSNWSSSSSAPGLYGTGYYYADTGSVSDGAVFFFKLVAPQRKTIDAWWTTGPNRSPATPFVMFDAQGLNVGSATVDQQQNGGGWRTIGTFDFTAGWNRVVVSRWAPQGAVVIADAVRVRSVD